VPLRDLNHSLKNLSVINLDFKFSNTHSLKNLLHNDQHIGVWNHRIIFAGDIEVTLIELSEATLSHYGLIAPIHLPNVEHLNLFHV
jgi:hypothetical protein